MRALTRICGALAALVLVLPRCAFAEPRTVCTLTIISPDEKRAFEAVLPRGNYRFVELVERGRPDWMAAACGRELRCDVLVVSGHFNGAEFFSDQIAQGEHLGVEEMERLACSASCPGVMQAPKEVYLFGCNTLNEEQTTAGTDELARSLEQSGRTRVTARRMAEALARRPGDSNAATMRRIFRDAAVIYGFPGPAPLGATLAPLLRQSLRSAPRGTVGSGQPDAGWSCRLTPYRLVTTAAARRSPDAVRHDEEACRLADTRASADAKLSLVHALLMHPSWEILRHFDRIERVVRDLPPREAVGPADRAARDAITADATARERYLAFARAALDGPEHLRRIEVARRLGWLTHEAWQAEILAQVHSLLASPPIRGSDLDYACTLSRLPEIVPALHIAAATTTEPSLRHTAVRACLGDATARERLLGAIGTSATSDAESLAIYLRHHPVSDGEALRRIFATIARMPAGALQASALEAFARPPVADAPSLVLLIELYAGTRSAAVQRAVAAILLRADLDAIPAGALAETLRRHRLDRTSARDAIDVLLRRLAVRMSFDRAPSSQ